MIGGVKMAKAFEFVKAPQRSEAWLELRRAGLGASDMAAVMGVSPYRTPYQLWAEKTGTVPPQVVGAAAHRGVILEDAVAQYYEIERGVKLRKSNGIVRLKRHPRIMASLDRTIAGQPEGIVEIKTSASPRWSMYPVPPEVVVQVTTQMGIVGAQWCDVVALLGGLVFKIERVQFDPALWAEIQRSAMLFLEAVDTKTPPALEALDAAAYALATPQDTEVILTADEKIERVYSQLRECNTELHFLEQKKGAFEMIIKEAIGENGGIAGGNWAIYWRQSRPSQVTDWQAISENLQAIAPETFDEACKRFTKEKPGTRRFIVRDGGLND
jgi:putative phage-type endonuclease